MYKMITILLALLLLMGCSAKNSSVKNGAIVGATVGTVAGALIGTTLALANGDTGKQMVTKIVISGILVGLAGAGIGSGAGYTKDILGNSNNNDIQEDKIIHQAIEQANHPKDKIRVYNKNEIVDVTDSVTSIKDDSMPIVNREIQLKGKGTVYNREEIIDVTNEVNTIKDEPIQVVNTEENYQEKPEIIQSMATNINKEIQEAYTKEIE